VNVRTPVALALCALLVLAGCATAPTDDPGLSSANAPPDPPSDRLGWEHGYWYNESLPITPGDGLNATEQRAVVHRAMARVEHLRKVEFTRDVPVKVISRETYRNATAGGGSGGGGGGSSASATFADARYEALFLVGEGGSGSEQSSENTASSVLGYYSPGADSIVIVSESKTPMIDERTLGHELVHAVQFRNFDMGFGGSTMEARSASFGLVEGDAELVSQTYDAHCGDDWQCVEPASSGDSAGDGGDSAGGGSIHFGIYFTQYFPYSDGPDFVRSIRAQGGWDAVNALYDDPPASAEQVALPSKYEVDPPTDVSLADRTAGDWERVVPQGRAPYGEFGVAGLTGMFAYTAYDDSMDAKPVLSQRDFLNVDPDGHVNGTDPIDYTTKPVDGWDGDELHVYRNDAGELGYVWKLVWDSEGDAREFADTYRALLHYWGANSVENGVYRIPAGASSFADAFYVSVDGTTVTIVNAPTVDGLDGVRTGTPTS